MQACKSKIKLVISLIFNLEEIILRYFDPDGLEMDVQDPEFNMDEKGHNEFSLDEECLYCNNRNMINDALLSDMRQRKEYECHI